MAERGIHSPHPCSSPFGQPSVVQIVYPDDILRASCPSALWASFAVHKTAGASFEHHAMRDGLEGEPQGCGE